VGSIPITRSTSILALVHVLEHAPSRHSLAGMTLKAERHRHDG
jgi:hypothetical protein